MSIKAVLLILTALGFGLAGGATYRYYHDTVELQTRLERTESVVQRTALRDALIGNPLPPIRLRDLSGEERPLHRPGQRQAIWFVDTERCPNCLEDSGAWQRLGTGQSRIETTLVLIGMDGREAMNAVRAKRIRTNVLIDPDLKLGKLIPLWLPSIYVLLDGAGMVTMADARSANLSCQWSFPGQLASVVGSGSGASEWIRP